MNYKLQTQLPEKYRTFSASKFHTHNQVHTEWSHEKYPPAFCEIYLKIARTGRF